MLVAMLDEQPLRLRLTLVAHAHERKRAFETLAVQPELDVTAFVALSQVIYIAGLRLVRSAIPEHHGAATVLAGGNGPLERVVLDRVILDFHRQPPLRRIERRSLRTCPALHDAVELESHVVVQMTRGVLLDHEMQFRARLRACLRARRPSQVARWLGRACEVALRLIFAERPTRFHAVFFWRLRPLDLRGDFATRFFSPPAALAALPSSRLA